MAVAAVWGILLQIWQFCIASCGAWQLGMWFPTFKMPMITGCARLALPAASPPPPLIAPPAPRRYLVIGVLVGPYCAEIVTSDAVSNLAEHINAFALAFIAFAAGAEIYFPDLRHLLRHILIITSVVFTATVVLVVGSVTAVGSVVPFMQTHGPSARAAIGLLFASVMMACSPASVLAIAKELGARGSFTKTVIGVRCVVCTALRFRHAAYVAAHDARACRASRQVTVMGDVFVLGAFIVALALSNALTSPDGFDARSLMFMLGAALADLVLGYALGKLLQFYLWIPRIRSQVRGALILPTGFAVFRFSAWLAEASEHHWKATFSLEPLLICIIASCLAGHSSSNRRKFANILHKAAPFIFLPFFTMTGASLQLRMVLRTYHVALGLFAVRVLAIAFGSFCACRYLRLPANHSSAMWMTLLSQAGVALGLANEVADRFKTWGADFATVVISVVVLNQLAGPVMCRLGMLKAGEGAGGAAKAVPVPGPGPGPGSGPGPGPATPVPPATAPRPALGGAAGSNRGDSGDTPARSGAVFALGDAAALAPHPREGDCVLVLGASPLAAEVGRLLAERGCTVLRARDVRSASSRSLTALSPAGAEAAVAAWAPQELAAALGPAPASSSAAAAAAATAAQSLSTLQAAVCLLDSDAANLEWVALVRRAAGGSVRCVALVAAPGERAQELLASGALVVSPCATLAQVAAALAGTPAGEPVTLLRAGWTAAQQVRGVAGGEAQRAAEAVVVAAADGQGAPFGMVAALLSSVLGSAEVVPASFSSSAHSAPTGATPPHGQHEALSALHAMGLADGSPPSRQLRNALRERQQAQLDPVGNIAEVALLPTASFRDMRPMGPLAAAATDTQPLLAAQRAGQLSPWSGRGRAMRRTSTHWLLRPLLDDEETVELVGDDDDLAVGAYGGAARGAASAAEAAAAAQGDVERGQQRG